MIQFVRSPADMASINLIGRIVIQAAIPGWPAFRHPYKVIEVSETAAIAARLHANYSEEGGIWLFTDRATDDLHVVKLSDIRAVCDDAEEANMLIVKSRDAIRKYHGAKTRIEREFVMLAGSMNKQTKSVLRSL